MLIKLIYIYKLKMVYIFFLYVSFGDRFQSKLIRFALFAVENKFSFWVEPKTIKKIGEIT